MYSASAMKHQPDDSQRGPFHLFTPGVVKIVVQPPKQRRPGSHFDQAVQAEADQGDRPGDNSGDDGDQTFGAVVGDGEVFEPLAPANKVMPILFAGRRHWFNCPRSAKLKVDLSGRRRRGKRIPSGPSEAPYGLLFAL